MEIQHSARNAQRRLLPNGFRTPSQSALAPVIAPPRISLDLSDAEAKGFHFFHQNTSREIPGCYSSSIWDQTILQLCHHEPAIRHAAVAVGAMHTTYRGTSPSLQMQAFNPFEGRHYFALEQYVKALRCLRNRLADPSDPRGAEVALICCLMFMCLEMLQGNRVGAVAHLRTGLRILSGIPSQVYLDYATGRQYLVISPMVGGLLDQLTTAFGRLDLESTTFGEQTPALRLKPSSGPALSIPAVFSDLNEAKGRLDILCNGMLHLRGEILQRASIELGDNASDWAVRHCIEHATARTVDVTSDPTFGPRLEEIKTDLARWLSIFRGFAAASPKTQDPAQGKIAMLLEIQHFFIFFQAATCREKAEVSCDRFNDLFKRIVLLSANFMAMPNATFTIESGVIPSLYLIALKCRDPGIRTQAISLLHSTSCQEGMWEGALIAKYVEQAAGWEESLASRGRRPALTRSTDIPEHARFCDVSLAASENPGSGRIVCARYPHESSGELVALEKVFRL